MTDCDNLLIHLNVGLIVTIGVILRAVLHSVGYTDAVYSNNFERIYRTFPESIDNLEIYQNNIEPITITTATSHLILPPNDI